MSGNVSTPENEVITVDGELPRIAEAIALDARKIKVTFTTGITKVVDLAPVLESRRFYMPLREDDALFRSFRVSEYRNALEWSDDLDFSAVMLDAMPVAEFSNAEFRQAMEEMDMSLDGMASALEVSRRLVADYRKDKPIPKHIGFATRYLWERENKEVRRTG
ncbi:MAG: hypothetical protein JWL86_4459 [Rhizobium sp.]|nr:hypothetical protein [Rhizobium sp.]